jgi:hypothetical protein
VPSREGERILDCDDGVVPEPWFEGAQLGIALLDEEPGPLRAVAVAELEADHDAPIG